MRETMDERNEGFEIDPKKLLLAYLHKWWLILLCGVVVAGAVLLYTFKCVTPMYRATVSVYVNNIRANEQIDYLSESNLAASQRLVNTYIAIVNSDRVLEEVSVRLGNDYNVVELREMLSAAQVNETEIFELHIVHPDPAEAQRVANALAEVLPEEIAGLIEGSSARIIDYAKAADEPYSPSYKKMAVLGVMIGFVLAAAYITTQFLLDVRIKDEEDLMALVDYPILGQIPVITQSTGSGKKKYGYEPAAPTTGKGGE